MLLFSICLQDAPDRLSRGYSSVLSRITLAPEQDARFFEPMHNTSLENATRACRHIYATVLCGPLTSSWLQ